MKKVTAETKKLKKYERIINAVAGYCCRVENRAVDGIYTEDEGRIATAVLSIINKTR
ncbi:MAG: hypothetical protein WC976_06580 [Caldisericia bacterium]